jgi:hypothetical protein
MLFVKRFIGPASKYLFPRKSNLYFAQGCLRLSNFNHSSVSQYLPVRSFSSSLTFFHKSHRFDRSESAMATKRPFVHLSGDVVPVNYHLKIRPNLDDPYNFIGSVHVDINVKKHVSAITINSAELKLTSAKIDGRMLLLTT